MFKKSTSDVEPMMRHRFLLIVMLTMMSMVGLVGSDIYLPAMPLMADVLHEDIQALQFTLSLYLCGLALGQLLIGPLTDRFGRKMPLIIGMAFYCVASMGCALSESYIFLLICRFIQAIGAASGLVIGRAIVADLFDEKDAGKVFATIFPFVGMSPAIAPVIGGFIAQSFGWQYTFVCIAIFAMTIIVLVSFFLPETLLPGKRRNLSFSEVMLAYPNLMKHRRFMAFCIAPCIAYIAYFAYLAQSPFIFSAEGYDERQIGMLYITLSITYVIGNITARRLLSSFSLERILYMGFIMFVAGGALLWLVGLFDWSIIVLIAAMSILTFGNGFLIPIGMTGALKAVSGQVGYASGLVGFLQLCCAAFSSSVIGYFTGNSVYALGVYIFVSVVIGFVGFAALARPSVSKVIEEGGTG